MALRIIEQLVDDMDGSDAVETVTFGLDGVDYVIDLSSVHAEELRHALNRFAQHGRRTGGRVQRGRPAVPARPRVTGPGVSSAVLAEQRAHNTAVRVWAREHGYSVPDRGRISAAIVAAYANRDSENSKVIVKERVVDTAGVNEGTVSPVGATGAKVKATRVRSTSPRSTPRSGKN